MIDAKSYDEIKDSYYIWLCNIIGVDKQNVESYWLLTKELHSISFYWSVANDDNRVGDAAYLREQFMDTLDYDVYGFMIQPLSVLEVLIGIAFRITDMMSDLHHASDNADAAGWYWHIIRNLDLWQYNDETYRLVSTKKYVTRIINNWLDRKFDFHGHGGLFPLAKNKKDQRIVEIWYQMSEYLIENYYADL